MMSSSRAVGRRCVLVAIVVVLLAATSACGGGGDSTAPPTTAGDDVGGYEAAERWLCRPGIDPNPCTGTDLSAASWQRDGSTTSEPFEPANEPAVDCFYLYPTVEIGSEPANVTDLTDVSLELDAIRAQAARLSSVCAVWAPLYPQVNQAGRASPEAAALEEVAYGAVREAFDHYRAQAGGRPVVLVGSDQGADLLTRIVQERFDADPEHRDDLLSAFLVGTGRIWTPPGQPVGGTFQNVPLCADRNQSTCIVSFNAYGLGAEPPDTSPLYASVPAGMTVGCANPAGLDGSKGQFRGAYFPTTAVDAVHWVPAGLPPTEAPFVKIGEFIRGVCTDGPSFRYVEVDVRSDPGDPRAAPALVGDRVGLGAGLHDHELQLILGDLIAMVDEQAEGRGL
jgi:hypothetical protein